MSKYETTLIILIPLSLYMSFSLAIFEARNPLSNKMAFFTEFKSVITFQKLDKYQPENYTLLPTE